MPTGLGDELVWYCPSFGTSTAYDDQTYQQGNLYGTSVIAADLGSGGFLAFESNGTASSYLETGYGLMPSSAYSVTFWTKGTPSTNEVHGVASESNFNNQLGFLTGSYQNTSQGGNGAKLTHFYQSNPSSYNPSQRLQSAATVFDNTWHHVVVTFAGGSKTEIYVDGVLDASTTSNVPSSIANTGWSFELGRYAGSFGYAGRVDDIRIFDRVITAAEAAHLATYRGVTGSPAPPSYAGLGDEKLWIAPTLTTNTSNLALTNGTGTGTTTGPVTVVADPAGGQAMEFNSTSSSYRLTWTGGSYGTYTAAFWYRNLVLSRHQYLFSYVATNGAMQFAHPLNSSLGYSYAWNDNNAPSASDFTYDDTWHHCVYQRSGYGAGGTSKFYADGVLVHSGNPDGSSNGIWNGSYLDIGTQARSGAGPTNWSGHLDDFRFYDRLLTQKEITWLATNRNVLGPPVDRVYDPFTNPVFTTQDTGRIR
jgi:hypothetical protein